MSFEAITTIAQAENEAKAAVSAAEAKSKQLIADAEAAGKAAVEAAGSKADEELAELSRQAKEKAKGDAQTLAGELENQKAALRARAEARLDQAASLVVERIVNS
jgi:V/A-type H+-transporting ATPase subunit G/H